MDDRKVRQRWIGDDGDVALDKNDRIKLNTNETVLDEVDERKTMIDVIVRRKI